MPLGCSSIQDTSPPPPHATRTMHEHDFEDAMMDKQGAVLIFKTGPCPFDTVPYPCPWRFTIITLNTVPQSCRYTIISMAISGPLTTLYSSTPRNNSRNILILSSPSILRSSFPSLTIACNRLPSESSTLASSTLVHRLIIVR